MSVRVPRYEYKDHVTITRARLLIDVARSLLAQVYVAIRDSFVVRIMTSQRCQDGTIEILTITRSQVNSHLFKTTVTATN